MIVLGKVLWLIYIEPLNLDLKQKCTAFFAAEFVEGVEDTFYWVNYTI